LPVAPLAPAGPAGPAGALTIVVGFWSQAARLNTANNADIIIERFIRTPLDLESVERIPSQYPQKT
jgi:hypothetical protein